MKATKRIIALCATLAISVSMMSLSASAFGGYAHWDIANRAVEAHNISSTSSRDIAFKSGCLLADIGKYTWDSDYTTSDTQEFAETMAEYAETTQAIYFARGWASHVYQDTYGDVAEIIDDGDSYRFNCAQIDEYLRDDLEIESPIDGTANVYVVYELIRNTYRELDGFAPTDAQINTQIEKMYQLYNAQLLLNVQAMSAAQITRMNNQFDDLAEDGYSTASVSSGAVTMSVLEDNVFSVEDLIDIERNNPAKAMQIQAIDSSLAEVAHIEVVGEVDGLTELAYVIEDRAAYDTLIRQYVDIILLDME